MQFTFIVPVLASIAFGLIVSAGEHLIRGWQGWRPWIGLAWRLAFLCYIILFGVIKV